MLSVSTAARLDAVMDFSTVRERGQWISERRVINLNPRGCRQTQKYRATVKVPRQIVPHLLASEAAFVGIKDITTAWKAMAKKLDLPMAGQSGLKLIRRSMAQLSASARYRRSRGNCRWATVSTNRSATSMRRSFPSI